MSLRPNRHNKQGRTAIFLDRVFGRKYGQTLHRFTPSTLIVVAKRQWLDGDTPEAFEGSFAEAAGSIQNNASATLSKLSVQCMGLSLLHRSDRLAQNHIQ